MLELPGRTGGAPRPRPGAGLGVGAGPRPPPVPPARLTNVCVASTSMFVGNDAVCSTNARVVSKVPPPIRWPTLNSGMSVVNRRVASMTAESFLPNASTLNAMMMLS